MTGATAAGAPPQFPQRGGCFCGDVRYELREDPLALYACHCTDCQRQTGSSFVLTMVARREAVEITKGELREYSLELPDDRRKIGRFCGRCSTRILGLPPKFPSLVNLRPGTLDDNLVGLSSRPYLDAQRAALGAHSRRPTELPRAARGR